MLAQLQYQTQNQYESSLTDAQAIAIVVVTLALSLVMIVAMWRLFTKAGQPGWHAIVPFLNTYTLVKVAGRPGWWFFLYLVPCVNYVVAFIVLYDLAKAFGRSSGFGVGTALLSPIFIPILAFGSSEHVATEQRRARDERALTGYRPAQGWAPTPGPALPGLVGTSPNTNPWPTPGASGTAPLGRTATPPPIAPLSAIPPRSPDPADVAPAIESEPPIEPAPPIAPAPPIEPAAASAPVPGWYSDPAGSDQLRYWDGTAWTDHLH